MSKITVIQHFDEDGSDQFYVPDGINVEVLTIDERAPNDRAYRRQVIHATAGAMTRIIGESEIGHSGDARHEGVRRRILGLPVATLVRDEQP